MADEITLTLEDPYIGSAYSPQVTVEEIEGGHSVTITSDVPGEGIVAQTFDVLDGDASQAIEDAEAAAAAARAAASSASSAATSATNAATAASTAAGQASTAAGAATDAASAATGAATSASAAAADATEAAGLADDATAAATAAASNAGTATREAIAATESANNAAASANAAAGSATDAASGATTAAGTATDAAASATTAASAAGTAADAANTAATAANAAAEAATEAAEGITDAYLPRVTVGASDGITGGGPLDTASWVERACPGSDGPARIESIHGNTIVQDGELLPVRMTGVESVGDGWTYQRAIDAGVLRGAGSVYDELTATEHITRVYEIALDGTENWVKSTNEDGGLYKFYVDNKAPDHNDRGNIVCNRLVKARTELFADMDAGTFFVQSSGRIGVCIDSTITSVDQLKAWLGNNNLHIFMPLNLPTVTPIDPPLNMTYKAAAGGTEHILHDEPTAPPTLVVQYGSTADGIRDRALAAIAAHDGPVAQTYHAVGTYLTLDGTLYKVTTAIAAGERITQGTNVTATTVMAEVLALTQ